MEVTFVYSNINAINTKISELRASVSQDKPDFILLTETWLNSKITDSLIAIPGYELFRDDRINQRGGEVSIYCKQQINNNKIKVTLNDSFTLPSITNSLWLNIEMGNVKLLLGCVYAPPRISLQELELLVGALDVAFGEDMAFICGDFNFPEIDWQSLTLCRPSVVSGAFLEAYKSWNVKQIIDFPTRLRGDQQSLLDLEFVTDRKLISNIESLPPLGLSDHVVIQTVMQLKVPSKPTIKVTKRNFWKANYNNVNNFIADQLATQATENCSYDRLSQVMEDAIDRFVPQISHRVNNSKPWITGEVLKTVRKKRRLWDQYKINRTPEKYAAYQTQNNVVKNTIKNARKNYEEGLLTQSDKQFFKYIKRSLNSNINTIVLRDPDNGMPVTDGERVAHIFARQFTTVFTVENLSNIPTLPYEKRSVISLESVKFTTGTVKGALASMKTDSSPGPDGFPTIFLQRCEMSLAAPLAAVMNHIMESENFPSTWKTAFILPIFKKGDKYDAKNYRPISLTCNPCKCMEKIIVKEITTFLMDHSAIPPNQHGFLPKRSTVTNLIMCLDEWTKNFDSNQPTDVIYLDYEKAFDKVPHERLLGKLHHYGIRGKLLRWIKNFLKDRSYRVRVSGVLSDSTEVISGVPQGSVLGPLLFIVYIADLTDSIGSGFSLYADDTKFFGNPIVQYNTLVEDLKTLEVWTNAWQLKLNENKCTVLHIGSNNPKRQYTLNGITLKSVNEQEDLGIIISSDLKWESHIAKITKKANSLIFMINKAFQNKSVEMIVRIFKTYVRPKLEYAESVWNPYFVKDIEQLERIQRRATRIPPETRDLPYPDRLKLFELPTLRERRHRGDLIETFKILNHIYCTNLNIYTMSTNPNLRGHRLKLSKEKCSKLPRKNFISNRIVYSWNDLSSDTIDAPTVNIFKNRLDKDLAINQRTLIHYL